MSIVAATPFCVFLKPSEKEACSFFHPTQECLVNINYSSGYQHASPHPSLNRCISEIFGSRQLFIFSDCFSILFNIELLRVLKEMGEKGTVASSKCPDLISVTRDSLKYFQKNGKNFFSNLRFCYLSLNLLSAK